MVTKAVWPSLLKNLIQPIKHHLAHQTAVLHDTVVGRPFARRRDYQFLPGVGEVGQAELLLPFDLGALILPAPTTRRAGTLTLAGSKRKPSLAATRPAGLSMGTPQRQQIVLTVLA